MQLRYQRSILSSGGGVRKISAVCWSPNNGKLAVATADRVVYLFDENGERKDKFKTKSSGDQTYVVTGMVFSPDSMKIAIAQSDKIVFVYRLGAEWGDKKSICNKFPQQNGSITCISWSVQQASDIVFGSSDGIIRRGNMQSNKSYTLFQHPNQCSSVSISCNVSGEAVICGYVDGSIYKLMFNSGGVESSLLVQHSCVPYALSWGEQICCAGYDCIVSFYDEQGQLVHKEECDEELREFTCACRNPAGDAVVLGAFNTYLVYAYDPKQGKWDRVSSKKVENLYTVSCIAWKPDGSKVALGSLGGSVDLYDACMKRHRYKGKFEFTYVSKSSVIVKTLKNGVRIVLKSVYGCEIEKINIYQDRYLIAHTPETLLMGDLDTCKLSEIAWNFSGHEKFHFENEKACMIYNGGELSIVEYGLNEIVGSFRTEHMTPFQISCVINEPKPNRPQTKLLAFLIDVQTLQVVDLISGSSIASVGHDGKVDWLELNQRGSHLLYRDKKRHLSVYDLQKQDRHTLLNYCSYVQWVPNSDVVVAQSRQNLCVWYSINNPTQKTVLPIKGEVVDIERENDKTEVLVDEGINQVSYTLDESLVFFGYALEEHDFERAIQILEPLDLTAETEAQWSQLADVALEDNQITVAARCYAALGNVCKARYLNKLHKLAAKQGNLETGVKSPLVRAKLAMLNNNWSIAESILLGQGLVDEVLQMYAEIHKWNDAIRVAETSQHPETQTLKNNYYEWLLQTGQEEEAGGMKEKQGDYLGAISLYLKGGLPGRAAQVVIQYGDCKAYDAGLLDSICGGLSKAGMYERAGQLYEYLNRFQEAKDAYKRANSYRKAVELARRQFPGEVVQLEEEWGDWCMNTKQTDVAINHYIEAGNTSKAIAAAFKCGQLSKAASIIEYLDPDIAKPYFKELAFHYQQTNNLEEAQKCYIKVGDAEGAVEMYAKANRWEAAHKVAMGYLSDNKVHSLYMRRARELEAEARWKEAEKMYLTIKEQDLAINMYKKQKMFTDMIRLVSQFRKDLLQETHVHLAQQCVMEGNLREAEKHFCDAREWKTAVKMYTDHNLWEDALRVAKVAGGAAASKQVAYAWAMSLDEEAGIQLLKRLGLVEYAIEYAVESSEFNNAFRLANNCMKNKLPDIHLKYAMYLEDEGQFKEAEEEFIKADKPREAIDMYLHQQDWDAAMCVAEHYDPTAVAEILVSHAAAMAENKRYSIGESLYLKAKRPELALKMYRSAKLWSDALRVAEDYLPNKISEIQVEMAKQVDGVSHFMGADAVINQAKIFERAKDYGRAIETYLQLSIEEVGEEERVIQIWDNAVRLAVTYLGHRVPEVVDTVAQRLMQIGRVEAAAELHCSVDDIQGAIRTYCSGGMVDKARQLARGQAGMMQYVDNYAQRALSSQAPSSIDNYVLQGDWDKVQELAAQLGPQAVITYAVKQAYQQAKQQDWGDAAVTLVKHNVPIETQHFELYQHIISNIVGSNSDHLNNQNTQQLRDLVVQVFRGIYGNSQSVSGSTQQILRYLYAAHYTCQYNIAVKEGWKELSAQIATSLLRYVDILPADKAFYLAGEAWRQANNHNMAFVFLNRYLDLTEAMEDQDMNATEIENSDFVDTDIPYDFNLPEVHYIQNEAQREEIRNWVLAVSMDQQVDQVLATHTCDSCGMETYQANLTCHNCKFTWQACVVSGYPVKQQNMVTCEGYSQVVAIRDNWNIWIQRFQKCPITNTPQSVSF